MRRPLIRAYKRLFVRRAFLRLHQRLVNIGLWGLGVLNSETDELSGEAHFLSQLPRYVRRDPELVVLDIGANVGAYAQLVRRLLPTARLYAFEPHPASFTALERLARQLEFQAFNFAVSAAGGQARLFDRTLAGSTQASLHRDVIEQLHGQSAVAFDVVVTTVDTFAREHAIEHIHLLKIDAEGSELDVLRGAGQMLAAGAIDTVQFEFNEMNVISRVFLRDCAAALPGYRLYRLLPDGLAPVGGGPVFLDEIFAFQNIVALQPGLNAASG